MTATQWVFVAGLFLIVAALAGIVVTLWPRRRNPQALLGLLFAVIAVVSTINITLVGHRLRVTTEEFDRRFAEQPDCGRK